MTPKTQRRAPSASSAADTENLHTDVMRFMAILGLCLAAIFALVQSVPLRGTDSLPLKPPQDPTIEQEHLEALQAEIERLTTLIGSTRKQNDSAKQALTDTRELLTAATEEAGQARNEHEKMAWEVKELTRRLQHKESDLQKAEQIAQAKSNALLALERRLAKQQEQAKPKPVQAELKTPRPARNTMVKRKPTEPVPGTVTPSTRQGFILRFASSDALAQLVSADTINLYGMSGKKAWRLYLPGGRPVFTSQALPGQFHEMTPATVPPAYVKALAGTPGGPAGTAVVWGVRLPPETTQAIADLTRDRDGGDLVIGATGQLYLNEQASTVYGRAR